MIMRKPFIAIVCLAIIVVIISYILAIIKVDSNVLFGLSFLLLSYLACLATSKFFKPSIALFALFAGIIITHIPWWISHYIKYEVSFGALIEYFLKGTKMSFSVLGVIFGYLLHKLISLSKTGIMD